MYTFILPKQSTVIALFFSFLVVTLSCRKVEEVLPSGADSHEVAAAALSTHSDKPNIILILGDDIGYEIPTYTGGQSYSTPNLDALSKQGMQFTNFFGMPMCSPSRFEMLTGKYNNRNYYGDSWGNLDLSQRTIANMLHNAGYVTCIAGKWQLNGGDASIRNFGFDYYSVTNPYNVSDGSDNEDDEGLSIYKDPIILQNGAYLPTADMKGKYGEDVNRDFLFKFLDSNKTKNKPFFAIWTPNLCHAPFTPTPDDPEFASWVVKPTKGPANSDTTYFKSMIKYFDKEIGMLINKMQGDNNFKNTVVLLAIGDNGTDGKIRSMYNGKSYVGGKGNTSLRGIHLPFIAYCPGKIASEVNTNLADFTDILPTIAGLSKVKVSASYGVIDGISFAPQLLGKFYVPRTAGFGYYDPNRHGPDNIPPVIYSFDNTYKVYDDSINSNVLFNYKKDMNERNPIKPSKMTSADKKADSTLNSVIKHYMQ